MNKVVIATLALERRENYALESVLAYRAQGHVCTMKYAVCKVHSAYEQYMHSSLQSYFFIM